MRSALLASLVVAGGCEVTATQLLVFVETDLDHEAGEIDGFDVTVRGPDLEPVPLDQDRFSLDDVDLPASFGVAPRGGDPGREVEVEVAARLGEEILFSTRAHTSYVEHDVQRLDLFLARRCRTEARVCESLGLTCDQGGCRSPDEVGTAGGAPTPEWEDRIEAPTLAPGISDTLRVGVDGASNVVVAGTFNGTIVLQGVELGDDGATEGIVFALPPEGGGGDAVRWVQHVAPENQGFVEIRGVAVDPRTGQTTIGGTVGVAFVIDGETVSASGNQDAFVATFDEDGRLLDRQMWGEPGGYAVVEDVALGPDGTRAISGWFASQTLHFGRHDVRNDTSVHHAFVASIDGPEAWGCSIPGANRATGVDVAPGGRLAVGAIGGDESRQVLSIGPDCDPVGLVFGTQGGNDFRIAADATGRLVGAGGTYEVTLDGAPIEGATGSEDGLVLSMAPDQALGWHRYIGSPANEDLHELAMSPEGTAYVVGSTDGDDVSVDGWREAVGAGAGTDGIAAAFAPDGTTLWARAFDTDLHEHWSGVAYDAATGAVVLVGYRYEAPPEGGPPANGLAVTRLVP